MCAHYLADPAVTVADEIIDHFVQSERKIRANHAWTNVTNILEQRWTAPTEPIGDLPLASVQMYGIMQAIDHLWRKARIVYAMDPLLVTELADSTSDELSGEFLRRIPHTNPLVTFAKPIPTILSTGQRGEVMGYYIYGKVAAPGEPGRMLGLTTTDDPAMECLGLMFVTAVLNERGEHVDLDLLRVTVPLEEKFTLADAVRRTLDGFRVDFQVAGATPEEVTRSLTDVLPIALNCLLYLCTERADVEPDQHGGRAITPGPSRQANQRGKKDRPGKPTRLLRVGWRLGPALHAARTAAADYRPTGTGSGQPPHQRKGHFKRQAHGPRHTLRKLIYLAPYMVRLDLLEQMDNRVIPVR